MYALEGFKLGNKLKTKTKTYKTKTYTPPANDNTLEIERNVIAFRYTVCAPTLTIPLVHVHTHTQTFKCIRNKTRVTFKQGEEAGQKERRTWREKDGERERESRESNVRYTQEESK